MKMKLPGLQAREFHSYLGETQTAHLTIIILQFVIFVRIISIHLVYVNENLWERIYGDFPL